MRLRFSAILATAAILTFQGEAAAQCLDADRPSEAVAGRLERRMFTDAGGRPEPAFILTLAAPVCLTGTDELDKVQGASTIHLVPSNASLEWRLQELLGRSVVARGRAFGSFTLHHHAPILISVDEIDLASTRTEPGRASDIIEPTGDQDPKYASERDPTSQQLIETWRSYNKNFPAIRLDRERFQIIDRRVAWNKRGRAFLQFQILSPRGDAMSWTRAQCARRATPVEVQVYYEFSTYINSWVPMHMKGVSPDTPADARGYFCASETLWSARQVEMLLHPPQLPTPPKVLHRDVYTPQPGTPERKAIMDALRPRYEAVFGKPVVFKVETLRIAAGFAFAVVHPQRPSGAPIEERTWVRALGRACAHNPRSATHEYWMRKRNNVWAIERMNHMCADDSITGDGDLIGAPPQLVDKDEWPERETMPPPD